MADQSSLIEKFQSLTGSTTDVAKFYLESCAWNCDEAIVSFYEEGNPMEEPTVHNIDDEDEDMDDIAPPQLTAVKDKKTTKPPKSYNKISTLSSLKQDDDDNDSSEEDGQAFYAGGPTAGQQILGPKRDKNDIKSVFSKAKQHGAEVIDKSEYEKQKGHKGGQKAFQGQAYRLGDSASPSEVVGAGGSGISENSAREIDTVLTFWSNGFTVNHGPLRDPADPDNALFLAQIKRGQVPKELVQEAKGSRVNLMMEDCSQQDYQPLKAKVASFGGSGHRLGSPATNVESVIPKSQTESTVDREESDKAEDTKTDDEAIYTVAVDDTKPTTNIQLRLPDGSRHVLKLNLSHTVQDIRNFVINTRTDLSSTPFILLSSFPRQELKEEAKSITDANLTNALVIVKLS